MIYLSQTGRPFKERFSEHLPTKNLTNLKYYFAKHIIEQNHKYTNLKTSLKPLYYFEKDRYMNAIEEFEMYKNFQENSQILLNDQLNFKSNHLYDPALKIIAN